MSLVKYTILYSSSNNENEDEVKKDKRKRIIRNALIGTAAVGTILGTAYLGNKYLNKSAKNNHSKPTRSAFHKRDVEYQGIRDSARYNLRYIDLDTGEGFDGSMTEGGLKSAIHRMRKDKRYGDKLVNELLKSKEGKRRLMNLMKASGYRIYSKKLS